MPLLTERTRLTIRAEHEAQQLRIELERQRIARDLHDVVGHALTTVTVQAGVAAHLLGSDPDSARRALEEIVQASGQALRDVRGIVGVLRDPAVAGAPIDPGPRLEGVADLVAHARHLGMDVTWSLTGPRRGSRGR